jgi:ribosomal protein L29
LCADGNVTIKGNALRVNGVDVLKTTSDLKAELLGTTSELLNTKAELLNTKAELINTTSNLKAELLSTTSNLKAELLNTTSDLKAELLNTKAELADLKAKVAALTGLKTQTQTSPASGSLVGTLLALSLTAAAVA